MEHITTTRISVTSESRPLGGRKLTDRHATAERCAQRFRPKPDFDRFEAVQILEEIGSQLPGEWRMTPQLIAHLRLLVRMTRPRDWHDGTPVVWMSVKKTAERLGITPAQVNRNENRLMALMLITFRDSANHKRFGTRCPESERITAANGIDLSPLGARLHYLRQMRGAIPETRSRKAAYRQLITRSTLALPILLLLLQGSRSAEFDAGLAGWVALRSLMLTLMYVAIYAAAPVVELSVIAAVLYTGPLFTTLFSALINRERVSAASWLGIVGGFAGVLLIIKPATDEFRFAMLIPMIAAILYALAAILTRGKCSTVRPVILATALNICLIVVGLIVTASLMVADGFVDSWIDYPFLLGSWVSMGQREWLVMAALAVLIILIGIGLAKAYQSAPSAIIATFDYSYLLFAAFWGFALFREIPDGLSVVGMIMIAGAGLLVIGPVFPLGRRKTAH